MGSCVIAMTCAAPAIRSLACLQIVAGEITHRFFHELSYQLCVHAWTAATRYELSFTETDDRIESDQSSPAIEVDKFSWFVSGFRSDHCWLLLRIFEHRVHSLPAWQQYLGTSLFLAKSARKDCLAFRPSLLKLCPLSSNNLPRILSAAWFIM